MSIWLSPANSEHALHCHQCGATRSAAECLRRKSRGAWVFCCSDKCCEEFDRRNPPEKNK